MTLPLDPGVNVMSAWFLMPLRFHIPQLVPLHLGKRANKLDKGILTIRFEMPFNVSCRGCKHTIARGVRFDAEKKTVGEGAVVTLSLYALDP